MKQHRTAKLLINCNISDYKRLQECNKESAYIWNNLVDRCKNFFECENRVYSLRELKEIVKRINTNVICAINKSIVAEHLFEAYNSISKARKIGED